MECQRLNKMIRTWYTQVQNETLAPARMVEFMEQHAEECDDCLLDPGIQEEIKKITAIILPPSKMTKPPKRAATVVPEMPTVKDLEAINGEEKETDDDSGDDDDDIEVDDEIDDDDDDALD